MRNDACVHTVRHELVGANNAPRGAPVSPSPVEPRTAQELESILRLNQTVALEQRLVAAAVPEKEVSAVIALPCVPCVFH